MATLYLAPPWLATAIHTAVVHPRRTLALWGIIAAAAAVGGTGLEFDTSTESVLDRSDPAWRYYRESVAWFGGDEIIVVAVQGEGPWDLSALEEVERLSSYFEGLPGVRRVDSLSTFQLIRSVPGGDLILEPAMAEGAPSSVAGARKVAERVLEDRIAPGTLVSRDGTVLAINLILDAEAADDQARLVEAIHEVIDPKDTWVSGVPVFRTRVNARTRSEILLFVPLTVLAIALLLFVIFGEPFAVVVSLLSSGAGMLVALGAMGALGTPITISTMILPSILLALGSAYVMHVLSVAQGVTERETLERSVQSVATPILLSGLTTAIGFVALSLIRIEAIRDLGGFGALGVVCVSAAAVTLAPAALAIRPLAGGSRRFERLLQNDLRVWLVNLARSRRGVVISLWGVVAVMAMLGLSRLEVETDAVLWFPHGSPVRDSYEHIRKELSGISPMNVVVEATGPAAVTSPAALDRIDRLGRHLEELPEVGKVVSLADPIAQIHAGFTGSPLGVLPDDRALIEQYLLLLESVDYIGDVVSLDRRRANIILRVNNNGSEALIAVARAAEQWWKEQEATGFTARTTGIMHEFGRSENEIAWGQLRGLGFALLAIGGLLFLIFRWPLVAGVATIPNVVPLAIVFGSMGLAGLPLDAVTVGLGSTALGIAVDDTIHLVNGYREGCLQGYSSLEAIGESLERVLPPLVYTTVVIAGGFAILALSNFAVTRNLGVVTAGVVFLCLAADLTLLPALLCLRRRGTASDAGLPRS